MIPWRNRKGTENLEAQFLSHLELIERTSLYFARRHGYEREDAEDFCSHVKQKLLEDEYGVFRKFQGRCSLPVYLKTVIGRLFIDYEIAQKGRWRPSTAARRMGTIAVELEELLYFRQHTFEEAYQILHSRHGASLGREELRKTVQKIPKRWGKSSVRFVRLDGVGSREPESSAETADLINSEQARLLSEVVQRFVGRLGASERLILRMRFQDEFTFDEIARLVRKKKLQVYWRVRKILSDLQKDLQANGLTRGAVREIAENKGKIIDFELFNQDDTQQS